MQLFAESSKVVHWNHGNKKQRDDGLALVTLYSTINHAHDGIDYRYKFSGLKEPPRTLGNMGSTCMYV